METLFFLGTTVAEGFDQAANAATVLKVAPLEDAVGGLAAATGFPADQLKTLLALLAAYPLSMIQLRLPSAAARHAFSAVVGLFLAQFVFGSQFFHSFVSCVVVYVLMALVPRSQSPVLVFIFTMLYLTIRSAARAACQAGHTPAGNPPRRASVLTPRAPLASHVYRMYIDYMGWTLDHTGPQMILTIKLSTLAWDVYDGTAGKKRAEAMAEKNPKLRPMVEGRRKRALEAMPSVLEYLSFVYHFGSFFAGPAFIMRDYKVPTPRRARRRGPAWLHRPLLSRRLLWSRPRSWARTASGLPAGRTPRAWCARSLALQTPPAPDGSAPPLQYSTAGRAFVTGIVCLGLFVTLSPTYKLDRLLDEDVLQGSTVR